MGNLNKDTTAFFNHIKDLPAPRTSAGISEDINPLRLKNILVDRFGTDWLDWFPTVTDKALMGDAQNEILSNKIQAVRIALSTDTPWDEWHIFENVGKAFNHQVPDFAVMQPLTVGECITTMYTLKSLRPAEDFSTEVLSYIASVAANENYVYLPNNLLVGAAQPILSTMIHDEDLSRRTQLAWQRLENKEVLSATFSEDSPLHRQLAKIALAQQFYKEFVNAYR